MAENPTPPDEHVLVTQARELLKQRQPAEAANAIRRYLMNTPGRASDHMLLGIALAESGEGLAAIGAMEQAAAMDSNDPLIAYNQGLVYRHANRNQQATAAFERALALHPGYDQAKAALQETRLKIEEATRAAAAPAAQQGRVRCPQCGMQTRAVAVCDWCSRPLANIDPNEPGAIQMMAAAMASSERSDLEEGPLHRRLIKAAVMMITSPVDAFNGKLDTFFNSTGAAQAVIVFFVVVLAFEAAVSAVPYLLDGKGFTVVVTAVSVEVIGAILHVVLTALMVAIFNAITGGADSFLGDFGSLALSFAFISATIDTLVMPIVFATGFFPGFGMAVLLVVLLWNWALQVILVMAATELNGCAAITLLGVVNMAISFGIPWLLRTV